MRYYTFAKVGLSNPKLSSYPHLFYPHPHLTITSTFFFPLFPQNCLPFIPYFMMGLFFAAAFESFHFALWDNHRRRRNGDKDVWRNEQASGSGLGVGSGTGSGRGSGRGLDHENASSSSSSSSSSVLLDVPLLGNQQQPQQQQQQQQQRGHNLHTVLPSTHNPLTHPSETVHHSHNNSNSNNSNSNNTSLNNQSTQTTTSTVPISSCRYAIEEMWEFLYRAFNVSDDRAMQVRC